MPAKIAAFPGSPPPPSPEAHGRCSRAPRTKRRGRPRADHRGKNRGHRRGRPTRASRSSKPIPRTMRRMAQRQSPRRPTPSLAGPPGPGCGRRQTNVLIATPGTDPTAREPGATPRPDAAFEPLRRNALRPETVGSSPWAECRVYIFLLIPGTVSRTQRPDHAPILNCSAATPCALRPAFQPRRPRQMPRLHLPVLIP